MFNLNHLLLRLNILLILQGKIEIMDFLRLDIHHQSYKLEIGMVLLIKGRPRLHMMVQIHPNLIQMHRLNMLLILQHTFLDLQLIMVIHLLGLLSLMKQKKMMRFSNYQRKYKTKQLEISIMMRIDGIL